jgi:alkaline phosphatase D
MRAMHRRAFLSDLARLAYLCASVPNVWRVTSRPVLADDPFSVGIASGDPTGTSVVIWTRLAPRPFDPDGGMTGQRTAVGWEVAGDEAFTKVVRSGRYTAAPELGFSVHVDVDGLEPGREYFYRFTLPAGPSPVGRLRTTPAAGAATPLRLAVASCQHFEQGLFTAYEHLTREDAGLVAHLGDYIYEYAGVERVRKYATSEIRTLDDYRARYAQTKTDPALKAAHAAAPWIVTWDDHEVDNNYAGLIGENGMESEEQMRLRRAVAYQAWWEHMPVRVPRAKSWADLTITRTLDWGNLARLWILDTRQYRSDQPCGDGNQLVPCGDWAHPSQTLLGAEQERWLFDGLARPHSGWTVLVNQVRIAPFDSAPGADRRISMDQWSGYPAALERMSRAIATHAPNRTIAITGDIHSNWVNELRGSYERASAPVVAAEFVGTSISSGGDGQDAVSNWNDRTRAENPDTKWHNARRGYVICEFTPRETRAHYRTVPFVTKPGAPIQTASSWRVEHGRPGIDPL